MLDAEIAVNAVWSASTETMIGPEPPGPGLPLEPPSKKSTWVPFSSASSVDHALGIRANPTLKMLSLCRN